MKIWILEDEEYIIESLNTLVRKFFPGNEIFLFLSATAAEKKLSESVPDIVISDIVMGEFSGLDFVELLREKGFSNTKIILISGHENFEFAQRAIGYKVSNYLLKPINQRKLIDSIQKCIEELSTYKVSEEREETRFVLNILSYETNCPDHEIIFPNGALKSLFDSFLVSFIPKIDFVSENEIESLIKIYDRNSICLEFSDGYMLISSLERSFLKEILELHLSKLNKASVKLGISEPCYYVQSLFSGLIQAKSNLEYVSSPFYKTLEEVEKFINENYFRTLVTGIFKNMAKIIFPAIRYVPKNKKEEEKYIEFLVNLYRKTYDFTLPFCDTLTDTKTIEGLPLSEAKQVFLVMISDLYKADKISSYSKKCLICDVATDLVDSDVKNASLGRISEIINLGTTYLSAVYTEINRSSFKDYLISAKMNLAKNLIRETQMDINSVSAAVGYSDVKYFRRLFRNNTGLIPAEYRKKESSEN